MGPEFSNPSPVVRRARSNPRSGRTCRAEANEDPTFDPLVTREIFEHVKNINDPEHPYSLEQASVLKYLTQFFFFVVADYDVYAQLDVVKESEVRVERSRAEIRFAPTVPSCSMVTLIGLSMRLKLSRVVPRRIKIDITVSPGSHSSEAAVNKQLNDKERVAAAMENPNLVHKVNLCLGGKTAF